VVFSPARWAVVPAGAGTRVQRAGQIWWRRLPDAIYLPDGWDGRAKGREENCPEWQK